MEPPDKRFAEAYMQYYARLARRKPTARHVAVTLFCRILQPERGGRGGVYQCVADAYIYRLNHTLTDSLYFEPGVKLLFVSTRLAIAFVFAGLFGMPTWCRLCREALSPSPPPRYSLLLGHEWGTKAFGQRVHEI